MHRTLVLDLVALTADLLGPHTPRLAKLAARGGVRPLQPVTPAVSASTQASWWTGTSPRHHGVIGNGWFDRDRGEIGFTTHSSRLIAAEKIWDVGRRLDPSFTCATLFFRFHRDGGADWSVASEVAERADGLRVPSIHTDPPGLAGELRAALGRFPFEAWWGPHAGIASSRWVARAARHLLDTRRPTLTLVHLPHLAFDLHRFGPHHPRIARTLREIDEVCGELIEEAEADGTRVVVLSEYGVTHVDRPIFPNRVLRAAGLLRVREERGVDVLDPGGSEAFAVVDHQIAHVYVKNAGRVPAVAALLRDAAGIERVVDDHGKRELGVDHARTGELVAIAAPGAWFAYPYWLDDRRAPDFARTVDPRRKWGSDPAELFFDPTLPWPRLRLARRRLERLLGLRTLVDVVPLDATLVHGSHGRLPDRAEDAPLLVTSQGDLLDDRTVRATDVQRLLLRHVFDEHELRGTTRHHAYA